MLRAKGHIVVQPKQKRVAVQLNRDFCDYYIWLIERYYKIRVGGPMHGGHISLALPKYDPNISWNYARRYHGQEVSFDYSPEIIVGGQTKNFRNFFLNVFSDELQTICLDIKANRKTNRFHITIANTKNRERVDWWPNMITIGK